MKDVNKIVWIVLFSCVSSLAWSQSSQKLKEEQEKLEERIQSTRLLLDKAKNNREASLNELKLIENQVKFREQLLRNYDNQIRSAEVSIVSKSNQIDALSNKLQSLKKQYKKLLVYAYKKRNKYGKLMYIFAADSYNEALKRKKYLESIQDLQQKQFLVIQQNQSLIKREIRNINEEKNRKLVVLNEKKKEKEQILVDKAQKESIYLEVKGQEEKLYAQLRAEERQKENLKARIAEAIRKEIAMEEERKRKEEEARKKSLAAKKIEGSKSTSASPESSVAMSEAREGNIVDRSFEANRGNLPWPVERGSITENFGKNPHPTLANVYTNNNGIDISAPKNAEVRSVFDGEITSILNIPGAGKVVIIKHGNYRTVYSNLQNVYVSVGDKVKAKQAIGALLVKPGAALSVVHFEIHQVVGSSVSSLNPAVWVDR